MLLDWRSYQPVVEGSSSDPHDVHHGRPSAPAPLRGRRRLALCSAALASALGAAALLWRGSEALRPTARPTSHRAAALAPAHGGAFTAQLEQKNEVTGANSSTEGVEALCCTSAKNKAHSCSTCWAGAWAGKDDYCGQSRRHCDDCEAVWCEAPDVAAARRGGGGGGGALPWEEGEEATTTAVAPAPGGVVGSCAVYGCVDFDPAHQCQCNPDCEVHGSCCSDYASNCGAPTVTSTTTSTSTTTLPPCHTAEFGSECYNRVMWVMRSGILEHPEWYPNITVYSSFEEIQAELHEKQECGCTEPCGAAIDPSMMGPLDMFGQPSGESQNGNLPLVKVAGTLAKKTVGSLFAPLLCNPAVQVVTSAVTAAARLFHPVKTGDAVWQLSDAEQEQCFASLLKQNVVKAEDRAYERNWCWVGLKEFGCHRHFYDHLTWAEMQAEAVASNATSAKPFHPLRHHSICDRPHLGGSWLWLDSDWKAARKWFKKNVNLFVLSLNTSTQRRATIKQRLDDLEIDFQFVDGVDMRKPGAFEAAKREQLIPESFNLTLAQEEAYAPHNGMGNAGSIVGTIGCASAHFRAQSHAVRSDPKDLTVILEDDVSPEKDFVPRLWKLISKELPCDWQAVSLYSRCPFGTCVSPHLTRVQPDVNEPAWRCRHGVNYGFQGMLYRTSEIEKLQKEWKPVVFDEARPHCLDVDVALASISDRVQFYAVPASHDPGFLRELAEGSSRVDINFQKMGQRVVLESTTTTTTTTSTTMSSSTGTRETTTKHFVPLMPTPMTV